MCKAQVRYSLNDTEAIYADVAHVRQIFIRNSYAEFYENPTNNLVKVRQTHGLVLRVWHKAFFFYS
jgi:hypothetical protein